jgi:hypothetical protein
MVLKSSQWTFYAQVLTRALNELESACTAAPETQEFKFYRSEAPVVLEEAREALAALKHYVRDLEASGTDLPPPPTRH